MLGEIGGLIKAIALIVGLFLPKLYQTPLYTRNILESIYKIMPDFQLDSTNLKIMGADSIPMERVPSDSLKNKCKLDRDAKAQKLNLEDVNYLT